jgi:uncharacterized protein (TIGR01319 family)
LNNKRLNTSKLCITDVGSTTTKAILFRRGDDGKWDYVRREAATTVERPHEDVSIGVLQALRALEEATGETLLENGSPAVPYLSTSSAGGGLAMVVTGLIKELTAETAERVALGAGAIVLDIICMNDGRTAYRQIEDLKRLRPDMVLLAGGYDGEAITAPVFLAELLVESDLHPKLNPDAKLPVVFGGNVNARPYVERTLGDAFLFRPVPNVRPAENREETGPARAAINEIFMDHVMSMAPGYEKLKPWVAAPIQPTPAAFGDIMALASVELDGTVLAIDVGGATTDVFTACRGEVVRTVSANIGMSYSVLNVARLAGPRAIMELLSMDMTERELWNRIGNKYAQPTSLPTTREAAMVEWATATVAIREAVNEHLSVLRRMPERERPGGLDYDLIIGSGGILSHSPREAAARMLIDALHPDDGVRLAVDRAFMFPHLGVLAEVDEALAKELFFDLALVELGTVGEHKAAATGDGRPASDTGGRTGTVEAAVAAIGSAAEQGGAPPTRTKLGAATRVRHGRINAVRELATNGDVLVNTGDTVTSDTVVAHASREFLRPFFLTVARAMQVDAEAIDSVLVKSIGDEVARGEVIAKQRFRLGCPSTFRSPVDGMIERILPDGTLVVRERAEDAKILTTVEVAKNLGLHPSRLKPYLKVSVGDEVERGQWLAAMMTGGTHSGSESPVRGKVVRIDLHFGMVMIEPLLEELQVLAWLPGVVESVTARGCTVVSEGTEIDGVWGSGEAVLGPLVFPSRETGGAGQMLWDPAALAPDSVAVIDHADAAVLEACREARVAGLIAGGVDLEDVLEPRLGFTLVVTGEFGSSALAEDVRAALTTHDGRVALLDGTTQLRVGVQRPRIILSS